MRCPVREVVEDVRGVDDRGALFQGLSAQELEQTLASKEVQVRGDLVEDID